MPWIMNALDEENTVVVGGNHFTFKPKQIKMIFQPHIADFIARDRREYGFVELPGVLGEKEIETAGEFTATPEGKSLVASKSREGIENYCERLRWLLFNQQVSLKRDLEKANHKEDPRVYANDAIIKQMECLSRYQTQKADSDQQRIEKMKDLEKKLEAGK